MRPRRDPVDVLVVALLRERIADLLGVWRFDLDAPPDPVGVGFLAARRREPAALWRHAEVLADRVGRAVQLVDLATVSTPFRARVVSAGRRVHCDDPWACDRFEEMAWAAAALISETARVSR